MARLGMAPTREKLNDTLPTRITMAMITYIPYTTGYYKDHMRISEICLNSMLQNAQSAKMAYRTLIFDQGSCNEWKGKLASWQAAGYLDHIYFSGYNIGKLSALHKIMNMVDSEIITYTDDDVLFFPGWLEQQMELIDEFPADLVTGSPILTRFKWYQIQHKRFIESDEYEVEAIPLQNYPVDWLEDDARGRGMDPLSYRAIVEGRTEDDISPIQVFSREQLGGWAVGHHMQFAARREKVQAHLPEPGRELMGVMREWDTTMDMEGLTQLSTLERTCRHMGNVLDNTIVSDAIDMELVI